MAEMRGIPQGGRGIIIHTIGGSVIEGKGGGGVTILRRYTK